MRRYGRGMLYAALPLHMQRGCFRIRTKFINNAPSFFYQQIKKYYKEREKGYTGISNPYKA